MGPRITPGQQLGEYLLIAEVRSGAMSIVFKAEHQKMKRLVAVKVGRTDSRELYRRFLRETGLSGRLSHPNILPAYDAGRSGETPFLVYKWVEGRDLGGAVRSEGAFPAERALKYILQAARYMSGRRFLK